VLAFVVVYLQRKKMYHYENEKKILYMSSVFLNQFNTIEKVALNQKRQGAN
jgi:hypothetical protein